MDATKDTFRVSDDVLDLLERLASTDVIFAVLTWAAEFDAEHGCAGTVRDLFRAHPDLSQYVPIDDAADYKDAEQGCS